METLILEVFRQYRIPVGGTIPIIALVSATLGRGKSMDDMREGIQQLQGKGIVLDRGDDIRLMVAL